MTQTVRASSCNECGPELQGLVPNNLFFSLLAVDLLPALIYVLGTRRWNTTRLWGLLLVSVSGLPWLLSLLNEVFALIAILGYPVLLVGCSVAAVKDLGRA